MGMARSGRGFKEAGRRGEERAEEVRKVRPGGRWRPCGPSLKRGLAFLFLPRPSITVVGSCIGYSVSLLQTSLASQTEYSHLRTGPSQRLPTWPAIEIILLGGHLDQWRHAKATHPITHLDTCRIGFDIHRQPDKLTAHFAHLDVLPIGQSIQSLGSLV